MALSGLRRGRNDLALKLAELDFLTALDYKTGRVAWRKPISGGGVGAATALCAVARHQKQHIRDPLTDQGQLGRMRCADRGGKARKQRQYHKHRHRDEHGERESIRRVVSHPEVLRELEPLPLIV